jgi:integrase
MGKIPKTKNGTVPVTWDAKRQRWMLSYFAPETPERKRLRKLKAQKQSDSASHAGVAVPVSAEEGDADNDADGRLVRVRRFFASKGEALETWVRLAEMVRRYGRAAVQYNAVAHSEWSEAKRIAGDVDLRDVARQWREGRPSGCDWTVKKAVDIFLASREKLNLSKTYMVSLKSVCGFFKKDFGDKSVASITGGMILDWLMDKKFNIIESTILTRRQRIGAFWNWLARREYIAKSPMLKVSRRDLPVVPSLPKETLSLEQCEAMMRLYESDYVSFVPWIAIQLFAGIRHTEAGRFQWEWIDFERRALVLPGWAMEKTTAKRTVTRMVKTGDSWAMYGLPDNLWVWLERYKPEHGGMLAHPRSQLSERVIRERVVKPWPYNCVRHTFCSMMISFYGDAAKVANWSRHRSPKQLYDSYVTRLVPVAVAKKFLGILPKPVTKRKAGSRASGSGRGEVSTGRRGG